jgi:hypothetical protein
VEAELERRPVDLGEVLRLLARAAAAGGSGGDGGWVGASRGACILGRNRLHRARLVLKVAEGLLLVNCVRVRCQAVREWRAATEGVEDGPVEEAVDLLLNGRAHKVVGHRVVRISAAAAAAAATATAAAAAAGAAAREKCVYGVLHVPAARLEILHGDFSLTARDRHEHGQLLDLVLLHPATSVQADAAVRSTGHRAQCAVVQRHLGVYVTRPVQEK